MAAPKGHKKWGGKRRGTKNKKTIDREKALELYRQAHLRRLTPLITAQQELALGEIVMLRRRKVRDPKTKRVSRTGELERIKDPEEIQRLLESKGRGEDWYFICAKDPNAKAQEDIFNRTLGKPKEEIEISVVVGQLKKIQDGQRIIMELGKKKKKKKK